MKFKRISTRLSVTILPIIITAFLVLTSISISSSKKIIDFQTSSLMNSELHAQEGNMGFYLTSVANMATTIANTVEATYEHAKLPQYEIMLSNIIPENDLVLGSGLWFEPYAYDKTKQYVGPYIYKKDGSVVTTYDYSNSDYDYLNRDYYTKSKTAKSAFFTDPYFDPVSNLFMSTCSAPIIVNNTFIGCVTVDIKLTTILDLVNEIKVGKEGMAMLTTANGVYLSGNAVEHEGSVENILEDSNPSLASAAKDVMGKEEGMTTFASDKGRMNLYFSTLPMTGWKLMFAMPVSELNAPIRNLGILLVLVSFLSVLFSIAVVLYQVRKMANRIKKVQNLANSLAEGDFTVEPIQVVSEDELGVMNNLLNRMYIQNKEDILKINKASKQVNQSSSMLREASTALTNEFTEIRRFMKQVDEEIQSTSASTEEVNASTEEVLSNVNILSAHITESMKMAEEIKERADAINHSSKKSFDSANALSKEFEKNLQLSIENSKIVESIGELADAISKIAGKINLLSLNASIEAARAGEAGKGFAVVATEIGALASGTAETVEKIQDTITAVKASFNALTEDAKSLLGFVQETVAPDYNKFVLVSEQYGRDAESIDETARGISSMAETITRIIAETTAAVQTITEASQSTTTLSSNIMASIEKVSEDVENVSSMSDSQDKVVKSMHDIVDKFKFE